MLATEGLSFTSVLPYFMTSSCILEFSRVLDLIKLAKGVEAVLYSIYFL